MLQGGLSITYMVNLSLSLSLSLFLSLSLSGDFFCLQEHVWLLKEIRR